MGGAASVLSPQLRAVLPTDAQKAWTTLAPLLPRELYLAGGTGAAVHLHHRQSRDLDLFFHHAAVDLQRVREIVSTAGAFAVELEGSGTLRGVFGATKLELLHADEVKPQTLLDEPTEVCGLRVAGLRDLLAMKLKVVRERGELRDYYDIKEIEQRSGLSVEDGLVFFMKRYGVSAQDPAIGQIVQALGYLDDIEADDSLPISKEQLIAWWAKRQPTLVRNLARQPGR